MSIPTLQASAKQLQTYKSKYYIHFIRTHGIPSNRFTRPPPFKFFVPYLIPPFLPSFGTFQNSVPGSINQSWKFSTYPKQLRDTGSRTDLHGRLLAICRSRRRFEKQVICNQILQLALCILRLRGY